MGTRTACSAPLLATPRLWARTLGSLYASGATAALLGTLQEPADRWYHRPLIQTLVAVAYVIGAVLVTVGRRLPRWTWFWIVLLGSVMITIAVAVCTDGSAAVAVASVWTFIAVDAFFFFAPVPALAQMLFLTGSQITTLALKPNVGIEQALAATVVSVTVGLVVGYLVQLASGANVDPLTGLLNRRGFDEALVTAMDEARRGRPLAVALVDVDHFKVVNDTRGHAGGDDVLRELAVGWSQLLPDEAALARRGGDEFAVLLAGTTGARAWVVLERLRAAGSQSISCGVAQYAPGEGAADLLRRADSALFAAKAAGRGRTMLSGRDVDELVEDLGRALRANEISVVLQPVMTLPGEQVTGVEALARWRHPRRGDVPPAQFVPVAESAGLIGDLGTTVLRQACAAASRQARLWDADLFLTVNASGLELTDPAYPQRVAAVLAETGWPARRLVVEVTESTVEGSTAAALASLDLLRRQGIGVAIDDFGTGYSAFSRLDTLPADYLKLDRSFISSITVSDRRRAMLRALLDLSAALGLQVIAEGVETREQADLLATLGCPLVQGYLFGRPAAVGEAGRPGRPAAPRVPGPRADPAGSWRIPTTPA